MRREPVRKLSLEDADFYSDWRLVNIFALQCRRMEQKGVLRTAGLDCYCMNSFEPPID